MPWNDDDSIKCDRCDRVFVPPVNLDRNRTVIAAGIAGWDIDGLEFGCPEHPNQDPLEEAEAKIKRLREWLEKERDAEVTTGYGLGYQNCALHALRVLDDAESR